MDLDPLQATALEIVPAGPLRGTLRAPSSKSITNRALVTAALAEGESTLVAPLVSDDTERMIECLRALGAHIEPTEEGLRVVGTGGRLQSPRAPLHAGASGTTMRFVAAVAALAPAPVEITGEPGLLRRPIGPLVRALSELGADSRTDELPPAHVGGRPLRGGSVVVDASASSQFVSALLLVAPYSQSDVTIRAEKLGAHGFIDTTVTLMRDFGVTLEPVAPDEWRIPAGQRYVGRRFEVEYDASAAAHLFALALATGGEVTVLNARAGTTQPDADITAVFERLGALVTRAGGALTVTGPRTISSFEANLRFMPDQIATLAALAVLAQGTSTISGAEVTRLHETDRISALATELRGLGAIVRERPDGIEIDGGGARAARIDPHDDHRIAMAFAAVGARLGLTVEQPGCVAKTYPGFWRDAATLGLRYRPVR